MAFPAKDDELGNFIITQIISELRQNFVMPLHRIWLERGVWIQTVNTFLELNFVGGT